MNNKKNEFWKALICIIIVCIGFYCLLKPRHVAIPLNQYDSAFVVNIEPRSIEQYKADKRVIAKNQGFGDIISIPSKRIKDSLREHEGYRHTAYYDTRGNPTIGIGFNLMKNGAKPRIESLGLNYKDVLNKEVSLTDEQINTLFEYDLLIATSDAISFLPNLVEQPDEVKIVIIDMVFNMGLTRLNKFKRFRQALFDEKYGTAVIEMKDSKWYHQVGNRSKNLVKIMESI